MEGTERPLDEKQLYEQGSKACQQYSDLTMRIRTIAQTVQIAYAVAMGLVLSRAGVQAGSDWVPVDRVGFVMIVLGVLVVVFGRVLGVLNVHYSGAFEAIRDNSLVRLERRAFADQENVGPWEAHQRHRRATEAQKQRAWTLPFRALMMLGALGIGFCILIFAWN